MALKLRIGNRIQVPVKGELVDGGKKIALDFKLRMTRLPVTEYRDRVKEGLVYRDFILAETDAWEKQDLVLDDNDRPAEFSGEALGLLLSIVGMEGLIWDCYVKTLVASHTEDGRRGN